MSRWEVFKQDAAGKPHQAVGSVHASDARHALVNAAHVFARRPAAFSLWVAPESAIYSRTAEQLATEQLAAGEPGHESQTANTPGAVHDPHQATSSFQVFKKTSHRRSMTFVDHVGTVTAPSPAAALASARTAASSSTAGGANLESGTRTAGGTSRAGDAEAEALAWWVVPTSAITASAPEDAPAWFEPAKEKTYKQQSQYGTGPSGHGKRGA